MKKTLLALATALALAPSAQAHEGGDFGTVMCSQNHDFSPYGTSKIFVIMRQIGRSRDYQLQVTEKTPGGSRVVVLTDIVNVETEDVMAFFDGKKASVHIYMDELNQASITYNGTRTSLICRPNWGGRQ